MTLMSRSFEQEEERSPQNLISVGRIRSVPNLVQCHHRAIAPTNFHLGSPLRDIPDPLEHLWDKMGDPFNDSGQDQEVTSKNYSKSDSNADAGERRRKWSLATRMAKFLQRTCTSKLLGDNKQVPVEQALFDLFKNDQAKVPINKFLLALDTTGLRKNDPRLTETIDNLEKEALEQELRDGEPLSIENLYLDKEKFKQAISDNIVLISKAFRQQFIIPEFIQFTRTIDELWRKCKKYDGGQVSKIAILTLLDRLGVGGSENQATTPLQRILFDEAGKERDIVAAASSSFFYEPFYDCVLSDFPFQPAAYIPQLARVNKEYWGVSLCTVDGQRYSVGDVNVPFTMQSTSKTLSYVVAHSELGADLVHRYIGQEPSGRMFNELVLDYNHKPHNPMINAGAILTAALLQTLVKPEMKHSEKFDWIMNYYKRLAGGQAIGFNNAVFMSEREDADRNYALAYYMRENKCFPPGTDIHACLDLYFQCCSMEVTCETMAVIAGTLANGGICPITGEQVLDNQSVRDILSIMHSCGMYDYSGQFAFKVGLPAKSGVSGPIMVVVPNVMGFCTWAPPLDGYGNSVKGVQFCKELVETYNFHRYDNLKHAENKKDPRRHKFEAKGLDIVSLLFSAASGDVTAMRRYHLSGMDMTQTDYDGRTALHLSAAEGHLDCVEFLLKNCNVNPRAKDRWGHTPIDDARMGTHELVVAFLKDWEAKNEGQYKEIIEEPEDDSQSTDSTQQGIWMNHVSGMNENGSPAAPPERKKHRDKDRHHQHRKIPTPEVVK